MYRSLPGFPKTPCDSSGEIRLFVVASHNLMVPWKATPMRLRGCSAQFERSDAKYLVHGEIRCRTAVHPCTFEYVCCPMFPDKVCGSLVEERNIQVDRCTTGSIQAGPVQRFGNVFVVGKERADLMSMMCVPHQGESSQAACIQVLEGLHARHVQPRPQESGAGNPEAPCVISKHGFDISRGDRGDVRIDGEGLAGGLVALIAEGDLKSALFIKRLHGRHSVHADGSARVQSCEEGVLALEPELPPDALLAKIRPHQEKAHEAERPVVGNNGSPGNQFIIVEIAVKTIGIRSPKNVCVMRSRVPSFVPRPVDQGVDTVDVEFPKGQARCIHRGKDKGLPEASGQVGGEKLIPITTGICIGFLTPGNTMTCF